jgi:cell division septal protein FtsQ
MENSINITVTKTYLPLINKQVIIKNIVDSTIDEETGKVQFSAIDFLIETSLLMNYTDAEISTENIIDFYDEIKENGILSATIEQISDDEIKFIKTNVQKEIQQYLDNERSLGIQFKKAVDKLLDKMPTSEDMASLLSDENIKKISKITKDLNKTFSVVK